MKYPSLEYSHGCHFHFFLLVKYQSINHSLKTLICMD